MYCSANCSSYLPIRFCNHNIKKLNPCVISLIPDFVAGFVQKMSMTRMKLFNVTFVNLGFILNITILIIWIKGIFKTNEPQYYIEC